MLTESGTRNGWMAGVTGLAMAFAIGLLLAPGAEAASGTWTYAGSDDWSDTTRWQGGIVADGADSTATISASISATCTITLDSPRFLGTLSFSDNTSQNNYWYLSDGGNSANTLTLTNTTAATPTIIASNDRSYVNVTLKGGQGVVVKAKNALTSAAGSPGLFFGRLNTYTGVTTVSRGILVLAANAPVGAPGAVGRDTSAIQIGDASSSSDVLGLLLEDGVTLDRDVQVNNYGGTVLVGAASDTSADPRYFRGNLRLDRSILFGCGGNNAKLVQSVGIISGSGGITVSPYGNQNSYVEFYANNTYSGETVISRGVINIYANVPSGANGAFGNATSDVILGDASTSTYLINVQLNKGCTFSRNIWVKNTGSAANVTLGAVVSGTPSPVYAGNIRTDRQLTLYAATSSSRTLFTGVISGTGRVVVDTYNNTGTIEMRNANTYSGGTTVSEGTLQLVTGSAGMPDTGQILITASTSNGAMDFNSISDTVGGLAGVGLVKLGSAVVTTAEGVSPGANVSTVGTLTVTGTTGGIALGATSTNLFHLVAPGNADRVLIQSSANLTLGGTLKIDPVGASAIEYGDYTLFELTSGAPSGSFTQISMPMGYKGVVSIVGNDVVLTVSEASKPGTTIFIR